MEQESFDSFLSRVKLPKRNVKGVSKKVAEPYRRSSMNHIPSAIEKNCPEAIALKDKMVYSGTLVKGICQQHKSNAVPVIDQEQMIDIARMRR